MYVHKGFVVLYVRVPVVSVLACVGKPLDWEFTVTTGGFFILCGENVKAAVCMVCVCVCVCVCVLVCVHGIVYTLWI